MDYAVNTYDLYRDIQQRTGGEIYIGVLGPVRTGKSTFIKRFMDEMVLPYMEDEHARMRAQDELPHLPIYASQTAFVLYTPTKLKNSLPDYRLKLFGE